LNCACDWNRHGDYGDLASFASLDVELTQWEAQQEASDAANRLWYFAVPPTVFLEVATAIKHSAMSASGWTRLVVEKPFGHDYDSCEEVSVCPSSACTAFPTEPGNFLP
jgi:glucose-6-phosphate 1-dehydrogenase